MLLPKWVEEGTIIEEEEYLLFPLDWQQHIQEHCSNMKVQLTDDIKANVEKFAHDSGNHPSNLIVFICRGFDATENKVRWEGNTKEDKIEFLSNVWFATNIWYPNQ